MIFLRIVMLQSIFDLVSTQFFFLLYLFARKLPSVSGTAGRTGGDWWGCQYQHPLMCLHKHSSHWAGLTRPRAKFDQICRNDVMNIMMLYWLWLNASYYFIINYNQAFLVKLLECDYLERRLQDK